MAPESFLLQSSLFWTSSVNIPEENIKRRKSIKHFFVFWYLFISIAFLNSIIRPIFVKLSTAVRHIRFICDTIFLSNCENGRFYDWRSCKYASYLRQDATLEKLSSSMESDCHNADILLETHLRQSIVHYSFKPSGGTGCSRTELSVAFEEEVLQI